MVEKNPKWFCAQIGAREHFAVSRALQREKRLAAFYTDFWAGSVTRWAAKVFPSKILRALSTRFHREIAGAAVHSWNVRSCLGEMNLRRRGGKNPYAQFIDVGSRFAVQVRESLKQRKDLNSDSIFFAYDTGALEAMEWCQERGVKCVLNQMDPNRVEINLVREEEKHWPGWQPQQIEVPEEYFRRREKEWALADRVLVNSNFCRRALVQQGVPSEKLMVLPLCYTVEASDQTADVKNSHPPIESRQSSATLRVLWLGQVILRKGIQYLIETARLLEKEKIQFDVVGPVGISSSAMASAPKNMVFHGRVARDQVSAWYRRADIFVLPTLSDGFAITQLEAMAYGLPVVTTPCCGEVVSDGIDGFIVPPRDAAALAKIFQKYLAEPKLAKNQQRAALAKSKQFTIDRLAANLLSVETSLAGG